MQQGRGSRSRIYTGVIMQVAMRRSAQWKGFVNDRNFSATVAALASEPRRYCFPASGDFNARIKTRGGARAAIVFAELAAPIISFDSIALRNFLYFPFVIYL